MKATIQWLALALLVLSTTGCLWLFTGGDKGKFPEGTYTELEDGRIEVTKKVTPMDGLTLNEGAKVKFSMGRITTIETAEPLAIDKVKVPAGTTLFFDGRTRVLRMKSAVLGETVSYGELEFNKGTELVFDKEGMPKYAFLKGKHTFEGELFRTKTEIWFEDGEIVKSKTLEQRDAERAQRAAERRACRNNCAVLSGAAHARCVSQCN